MRVQSITAGAVAALCIHQQGVTAFQPVSSTRTTSSLSRSPSAVHHSPLLNSKPASFSSSVLRASTVSSGTEEKEIDTTAISKYAIAGVTQLALFSGSFFALDTVLASLDMSVLPTPVTWILFYAISLKSRVFNPLNNERPQRDAAIEGEASKGFQDRIMPKWTPPGVVFPIMWLLIIAPLRATASTFVVNSIGHYFDPASIMCLILHLTIGDIWNTINNAEGRYGTSVLGVLGVWTSAAFASHQYWEVDPLAGKLVGLTCIWLTIASALITQTWRLNVDAVTGEKDPLLPKKTVGEDSITKFTFE